MEEETKGEDNINNNETETTKPTSLLKLQSLQNKSLRIISRIHELESILADDSVSTVNVPKQKSNWHNYNGKKNVSNIPNDCP